MSKKRIKRERKRRFSKPIDIRETLTAVWGVTDYDEFAEEIAEYEKMVRENPDMQELNKMFHMAVKAAEADAPEETVVVNEHYQDPYNENTAKVVDSKAVEKARRSAEQARRDDDYYHMQDLINRAAEDDERRREHEEQMREEQDRAYEEQLEREREDDERRREEEDYARMQQEQEDEYRRQQEEDDYYRNYYR